MDVRKKLSTMALAVVMFGIGGLLALAPGLEAETADAVETYRWVGESYEVKLKSVTVNGDEVADLSEYYPRVDDMFDIIAEPYGMALRGQHFNSIFERESGEER